MGDIENRNEHANHSDSEKQTVILRNSGPGKPDGSRSNVERNSNYKDQ